MPAKPSGLTAPEMARLFFLADSLPLGGVTSYLKTLCAGLQHRGHDVTVLINEGEDRSEEPWPEGVRLKTLPVGRWHTRASLTRQARRYLLEAGAEWVYFNNCYYVDSYALRKTALKGVYVAHSNMEEELGRFEKEGLYCHDIIGPTPGVAARFQHAFPDYRSTHIAHGTRVPPERLAKTGPFQVLYLGRISPEKGVDLLAPIMGPLLNRYPDMQLTVLGNGIGRESFANEVRTALRKSIDRPEQLQLPGTLDRAALEAQLRAAHVLLLPSREEAFGLAAIEAAAWGAVPVVTCIAGVTDRIFKDGEDAFLPPQDDVTAFQKAVECLYNDTGRRDAMAHKAYQNVKKRFSVEAMAAAYDALMREPAVPAPKSRNRIQKAYGLYRNILFLRARKALN